MTILEATNLIERALTPEHYYLPEDAQTVYNSLRRSGTAQRSALDIICARYDVVLQCAKTLRASKAQEAEWTALSHELHRCTLEAHIETPAGDPPLAYAQALQAKASTPRRVIATQGR